MTPDRSPMTPAVYPYLYEVLWQIATSGPVGADALIGGMWGWTPQETANRLRSALHHGLVERDQDGFWMLTPKGRDWMAVT